MQIASGWSKGLKILTPEGTGTRPTRERVRAAALNMLMPWIADAAVLDLFAGSGAVGLELVSRGSRGAIFVEKGNQALNCIRTNMRGLKDRAAKQGITLTPYDIVPGDAITCLKNFAPQSFDIIWADPPYELAKEFLESACSDLAKLLKEDGIFAFECGVEDLAVTEAFAQQSGLSLIKQREYGVTLITIWQKPA